MVKLLFVCHGNICRSPMAEFVMKDLVEKAGLEKNFHIGSAATSTEEIGNPVYPPARRKLAEHGISCGGHAARQLTWSDYGAYDLLIGMDRANLRNMERICGGKYTSCWSTPIVQARRWPTPGTPEISRPPGRMCWRGARGSSCGQREPQRGDCELLSRAFAEIGGSIGSSRGQTVCLKEPEQTAKEQPPGGTLRRAALHFIQSFLPQAPVRHQQAVRLHQVVRLQQGFCLVQGRCRGHIDGGVGLV